MQNYFNFQVHSVVPELLIEKSWFFWNNFTLISIKMIIHQLTGNFCLAELVEGFTIKYIIFN